MVFFAVIGNLAVISVILTKRVLRTKINIYLLNLSVADLLMATLNAMFNFVSMVSVQTLVVFFGRTAMIAVRSLWSVSRRSVS